MLLGGPLADTELFFRMAFVGGLALGAIFGILGGLAVSLWVTRYLR